MLDIDLVYNLYESLSPERKETLKNLLFKKSRQTMAYFRRSKDISMSKLEILSDFYHLPMDNFREGNKYPVSPSAANSGGGVGNFTMNNNLVVENENLRKQVASLEQQIENLNIIVSSKDETNAVLKELVETLRIVQKEQRI